MAHAGARMYRARCSTYAARRALSGGAKRRRQQPKGKIERRARYHFRHDVVPPVAFGSGLPSCTPSAALFAIHLFILLLFSCCLFIPAPLPTTPSSTIIHFCIYVLRWHFKFINSSMYIHINIDIFLLLLIYKSVLVVFVVPVPAFQR